MLTYFIELAAPALSELLARPGVIDGLVRQGAAVAMAILDLNPARREAIAALTARGIPVTAWLVLHRDAGYWLTADNGEVARARYHEVQDWLRAHDLEVICFGLDVETPIDDSRDLFARGRQALYRLFLERRSRDKLRKAAQAYDALLDEIRRDGYAVESYQFPLIVDERRARSQLLQRALGVVDIKTDREVLMLYRTLLPRPFDALLVDAFGPDADAIAVGITGGGVDFVLEETQRLLSLDELLIDLRRAARYTRNLYIFSLEGCVEAGIFEALDDVTLDPMAPAFGTFATRMARWALRALLSGEALYDRANWPAPARLERSQGEAASSRPSSEK
ncbi:MAG: hypothetical protein KAI47_26365 [Deltaproteobacteria bacterium]|nr:hypothetical protein [Deltaproteobacteria bacterium]